MQSVTLNQTLHGYKDGHRAIASSIELSAQDTKTLLVLSDISGPGSRLESAGYLTGYPLPTSGVYALARTWPAPEMSRPGCVWTHTLLIDFADLATIVDPTNLLSLFRRPDQLTSAVYGKTVVFDDQLQVNLDRSEIASFAKPLIAALYQHPSKPIISVELDLEISENAVLALWAQQWPRLRRSFRFCTMASADRSTKDTLFDLQLLPKAMPSARSRFVNALDAGSLDEEPSWLRTAVEDIAISKLDGLRQFLFHAGSDLQNGRSSFATLCSIYNLMEGESEVRVNIEAALKLIPGPSEPKIARALKGIVVRRLFKQPLELSKPVLSYMIDHLDLMDRRGLDDGAKHFGEILLRAQPKLFLKLSRIGKIGEEIFLDTLKSAHMDDILVAAKKVTELLSTALEHRSELLQRPLTWTLLDEDHTNAVENIKAADINQAVLRAAIIAKRVDLAEHLLSRADQPKFLMALHQSYAAKDLASGDVVRWLETIGSPSGLGTFFSSADKLDRGFLLAVSQLYSPEVVFSKSDRDPWLSAIENAENDLSDEDELTLRSYLLIRSLYDDFQSAEELAKYGFEATDNALAENRLPYELWNQLEVKLPWPMFWQDWDKCYRLRKGVVDRCTEDRWPAEIFASLTSSDELFAALVAIANDGYRGREYLKAAQYALKNHTDPVLQKRRAIIKKFLKEY